MSKIEYPTLDLFIYNLIEQSGEIEVEIKELYENYWSNLPDKLQQKHFSTQINHEDTQRLDFKFSHTRKRYQHHSRDGRNRTSTKRSRTSATRSQSQ